LLHHRRETESCAGIEGGLTTIVIGHSSVTVMSAFARLAARVWRLDPECSVICPEE
jgi:hypothetical protein